MNRLTINRLVAGGVITNYRCVSRCGHCLYNCGPSRQNAYLEPDLAGTIFDRIARMGCRSVHIGGGEPLLDTEGLMTVLEAAQAAGVSIVYVETNSAWYRNRQQAVALLKRLRSVGVQTMLISISPFHNAFIPYDRVKGVIEACRLSGMQAFPWVNAFVRDLERLGDDSPHGMDEFEAVFGEDYLRRIPDRYWIHLGGRALETFRPVYPNRTAAEVLDASPATCGRSLADTTHFHIDLYGNYIPGLCAGLAVSLEDLGSTLDEAQYPLMTALVESGVRGLYDLAVSDHDYVPWRNAFINHCDLCTDIRRFLATLKNVRFDELAPNGFYKDKA